MTKSSGTPLELAALRDTEVIATPVGDIALVDSYFDDDASARLYDEMDYQRAVQGYLWLPSLRAVAAVLRQDLQPARLRARRRRALRPRAENYGLK